MTCRVVLGFAAALIAREHVKIKGKLVDYTSRARIKSQHKVQQEAVCLKEGSRRKRLEEL